MGAKGFASATRGTTKWWIPYCVFCCVPTDRKRAKECKKLRRKAQGQQNAVVSTVAGELKSCMSATETDLHTKRSDIADQPGNTAIAEKRSPVQA